MLRKSDQFYSNLEINRMTLPELFTRPGLFYEVPEDWHVVITDIRDSTAAVLAGLHETVNLIATGSIVTVLNIVFKANLTVPFFFGGDGATFIVPSSILAKCLSALMQYRQNTLKNFELDLRVGTLPANAIHAGGESLRISKFSSSGMFTIPVVLGNGLSYAEKLIKGEDYSAAGIEPYDEEPDLSGMQCRWDRIAPPENSYEIVTLLAISAKGADQAGAFQKVMQAIDRIYGTPEKRQPISLPKLKLTTTFNKFGAEQRISTGRINLLDMAGMWIKALAGYFYFRTETGRRYLKSMIDMADTLVIDGKINTVISGTEVQRLQLQEVLSRLEAEGEIIYGLYVSRESVMSCYVRDMKDDHIHFVDGSEGGYTRAAGLMKFKLGL